MSSSLNVLSRYLDALAAPHILCDRDYRIRFANRAYRERFAYGAEIVGQPCFAVSHHYRQPCNDCGESCPLQRSLQSRQMERGVHLHHSAQGEEFVEIELTPVFGDDGLCEFFIERMQPLPLTPVNEAPEPARLVAAEPGADCAHVAVERAAGNRDVLWQTQALRPLFVERAYRDIGGEGVGKERVRQALVEDRVELIEERGRRQAAPAFVPQGFMPGAAAAAAQILRTGGAGEQGGYPVAKLHPRGGCLGDGAIFPGDVEDFGPEPFAGVNPANIARVILFARLVAQAGDRLGFLDRGVIFPQEMYSEFFPELTKGLEKGARQYGLNILLAGTDGKQKTVQQIARSLYGKVDGLVFAVPEIEDSVLDRVTSRVPNVWVNHWLTCGG